LTPRPYGRLKRRPAAPRVPLGPPPPPWSKLFIPPCSQVHFYVRTRDAASGTEIDVGLARYNLEDFLAGSSEVRVNPIYIYI